MLGNLIENLLRTEGNFVHPDLNKRGVKISNLKEGDYVAREGHKPSKISILLKGTVYVTTFSTKGDRIISHTMEDVQFFCIMETIKKLKYNMASVIALTDVKVLEIDAPIYMRELEHDKILSQMTIDYLCDFSVNMIRELNKINSYSIEENMLSYFYYLAKDKDLPFELKEKRTFYADLFKINVRTFYRYLNEWVEKNYIVRERQRLYITMESLKNLKKEIALL